MVRRALSSKDDLRLRRHTCDSSSALSSTTRCRRESSAAIADSHARRQLGRRVDARWVPPDNLHITLWFIGDVAEDRACRDHRRAVDAPFVTRAFDLELRRRSACFRRSGAPRVFWLGVREGAELDDRALHAELAARLQPLGFAAGAAGVLRASDNRAREGVRGRDSRASSASLRRDAGGCRACRIRRVTVFPQPPLAERRHVRSRCCDYHYSKAVMLPRSLRLSGGLGAVCVSAGAARGHRRARRAAAATSAPPTSCARPAPGAPSP